MCNIHPRTTRLRGFRFIAYQEFIGFRIKRRKEYREERYRGLGYRGERYRGVGSGRVKIEKGRI